MRRLAGPILAMTMLSTAANAEPAGPVRSAILDAARIPVQSSLGQPVRFRVTRLEVSEGWAFLIAEMQDRAGAPISYAGARYASDAAHGAKSRDCVALLRLASNGHWQVVEQAIGPTDVPWIDWADKHRAPPRIFPSS